MRVAAVAVAVILLAAFVLSVDLVRPRSDHLTLLTVATGAGGRGGTADVYLELRPGKGSVYIDTFPFTKLDTQVSTRFAKEVACGYLDAPCNQYDFFYTIRADSSIIGGPSAGAAIAALTVAVLEGHKVDQGVAMTGTINAGGLVGAVGGVEEKVAAAEAAGMHTVIVPRWAESNASNATRNVSIAVVPVTVLSEAVEVLTGVPSPREDEGVVVPADYAALMASVADRLCERSRLIQQQLPPVPENDSLLNVSEQFLLDADRADGSGFDYSRASYCFSANLRLRELQLRNFSEAGLDRLAAEVGESIAEQRLVLAGRPLRSITDVQTMAIVTERLNEAEKYLEGNRSSRDVAYAVERYYSATVWGSFFSLDGSALQVDGEYLRLGCEEKLAEVEERVGYLSVLYGSALDFELDELDRAYDSHVSGDYALCLFQASKAKASVDVVLSSAAVGDAAFGELVDEKLLVVREVLLREALAGRFPLMGYAYYEYAGALRDDDPYVAALFSSYALELSDLERFFPPHPGLLSVLRVFASPFMVGFLFGVFLMLVVFGQKYRVRRRP